MPSANSCSQEWYLYKAHTIAAAAAAAPGVLFGTCLLACVFAWCKSISGVCSSWEFSTIQKQQQPLCKMVKRLPQLGSSNFSTMQLFIPATYTTGSWKSSDFTGSMHHRRLQLLLRSLDKQAGIGSDCLLLLFFLFSLKKLTLVTICKLCFKAVVTISGVFFFFPQILR